MKKLDAHIHISSLISVEGMELHPLGLPDSMLEDIYHNNIKRFLQ